MKVVCVGAGYVGTTVMGVMAKKNPESDFTLLDSSEERIAKWQSGTAPIHEPGLSDLLAEVMAAGNLHFLHDSHMEAALEDVDMVFMAVGVKNKAFGLGKGRAPDLSAWEDNARRVAAFIKGEKKRVVVELSTVPVKASTLLSEVMGALLPCPVEVVSNPVFLSSGTALSDTLEGDRILLGGGRSAEALEACDLVASLYRKWVPEERILKTETWSSELAKLITNAMLAQRISSINAVAAVCEATGAEVGEVSEIVGMDSRINDKFLQPSVGFGGQALTKILMLTYMCESLGLEGAAQYWQSVIDINEYSKKKFSRTMISAMFNTVQRKKIAILGFTFKANTTDTRESAAIAVCRELLTERAELTIYDPLADAGQIMHELRKDVDVSYSLNVKDKPNIDELVTVETDVYKACEGAHAIAILTEHDMFRDLDFAQMYSTMQRPAHVFDGRRVINCAAMRTIGFSVYQIGAGAAGCGDPEVPPPPSSP